MRKTYLLALLLVVAMLLPGFAWAQTTNPPQKSKPEKEISTVRLRIQVSGGEKDQPVESASVYVKFVQERTLARDKKLEMNFKTNRDGVVRVPEIRRGRVLIQVIAEGWKTFGRWYDIQDDDQTIKIHLEKPPRWY